MKFFYIIIFSFSILLLQACGSTKKIVDNVIAPKTNLDSLFKSQGVVAAQLLKDSSLEMLQKNFIDFKTFSAKAKVESQDNNGKNPDITAVIKMVKDSAIWISLTATFLNVEVYRAYITPDSVTLLDKRDKTVQYRSLNFLQEVTNIPFDFKSLQNMLIGNPVFFDTATVQFNRYQDYILGSSINTFFKNLLTLTGTDAVLLSSKLDDTDASRNRTAYIQYDGYEKVDSLSFATIRRITISEVNKLDVFLQYKQMEFNKDLSVNFNVPKSYTVK